MGREHLASHLADQSALQAAQRHVQKEEQKSPQTWCLNSKADLAQNFSTWTLLTLRPRKFFVVGVVLCIVGCVASSLPPAPIHQMPVTFPPVPCVTGKLSLNICHTSPGGSGVRGTKSSLMRTIDSDRAVSVGCATICKFIYPHGGTAKPGL